MPHDLTIPTATTLTPPTGKPYTAYTVALRQGLRTTHLQKRYSDFVALHAALTAAVGTPPPAPLPAKSWFFASTVGNPKLVEDRRRGLEAYAQAIENAEDARWRNARVWREFLGLASDSSSSSSSSDTSGGRARGSSSTGTYEGSGGGGSGGGGGGGGGGAEAARARTASGWLDLHRELKTALHDARLWLNRREGAGTAQAQHEAAAGAKRELVRAAALINALEEGLRVLAERRGGGRGGKGEEDGWGAAGAAERLGEGEVRRRRDLVGAARKEREGLEGVLSAMAVKSAVLGGAGGGGGMSGAVATQGDKEGLFAQGGGVAAGGAGRGGGRRVLGAPLKETERTRELDNEGVLQLQRQIMREQDEDVQDLAKVVRRMREMGVQINEELVYQNALLDELDQDVERNEAKIAIAKKRIGKIK